MLGNQSCSSLPNDMVDDEAGGNFFADFVSSLPKERGCLTSDYLYNYQGYWIGDMYLEGVVEFQNHFRAQDSDVFLITTPKSGTIWLKALAFATLNRVRHGVSSSDHPLLAHSPHELVPFIDILLYGKMKNIELSSFESPRLFATHIAYDSLPQSVKDSACKIVYLCSNPKDTFISYWHFMIKLRPHLGNLPMDEEFERFCKGITDYGPYWDQVLGYWEKSLEMPRNVLFLKFEDLKDNLSFYLRKLAEFMGCPFSLEEEASGVPDQIIKLCSFDNLSNLEVNRDGMFPGGLEKKALFRRGEVGDWKNYLTHETIKRIDDLAEDKFGASGLQF